MKQNHRKNNQILELSLLNFNMKVLIKEFYLVQQFKRFPKVYQY